MSEELSENCSFERTNIYLHLYLKRSSNILIIQYLEGFNYEVKNKNQHVWGFFYISLICKIKNLIHTLCTLCMCKYLYKLIFKFLVKEDERPRVDVSQQYIEVNEGHPIEVRCQASGIPAPELSLLRLDGQTLSPRVNFTYIYCDTV